MSIKKGARKLAAYQGNFGQSKAANYSKFAGILADETFRNASDGMSRAMNVEPGRARKSMSLRRVMAGVKHSGGISSAMKEDMIKQQELIEDQANTINDLSDAIANMTPDPTPSEPDEGVLG